MSTRHMILATLALTLTACPKPLPDDPQPTDCKKEGQACVDQPAPEGPPPIGKTSPPR